MDSTIKFKSDVFEELQLKSKEIGVEMEELANEILSNGLKEYPKELVRIADSFPELIDIIEVPEGTDPADIREQVLKDRS